MTVSGVDPIELRRHASVGRPRRPGLRDRPRGLAHLYAAKRRRPLPDLFVTDQAEARGGSGFRWFFSTMLAAGVGAVAIAAVIFGSLEVRTGTGRVAASLRQVAFPSVKPTVPDTRRATGGLAWTIPKSDRLETTMDAVSTRYIVQDSIRERRANREYLLKKPYARVLIRLAAVEPDPRVNVPPFNPLKLYATTGSARDGGEGGSIATAPEGGEVTIRVVELLGSILPAEDGQEMDAAEVSELVHRMIASEADRAQIRPSFVPEGLDLNRKDGLGAALAYTTILHKTTVDSDEPTTDEHEGQRIRVKIARGETLSRLLVRMGADAWQARDMVDAARTILPESQVVNGHDVELTLAPSLSESGKPEPTRYSVFGPGGEHRVTVERNAAGEFAASTTPPRQTGPGGQQAERAVSLYNSLYHGALAQGIPAETVQAILRVHAYEADFRRRARGSDAVEMFFDLKEEDKGADGTLGELLLTSMTIGGTTQRFYRFKEADGSVDFYDANGNNSRRFLLRKPTRSEDVRLTSGFGIRFHPLLNQRKLHAGVDWAGPIGTPIIAAGNGTIEEAGYKGQYGNYVRIRHANSYQTAYGHMRGFAPGVAAGIKVRQGDVIGYLGSSGLSSGPHVHFEVLVGNRWVDPLSIQVPREKRLTGRQLAAFQRERVRIEELMRQPPVRVSSLEARKP